MKLQELFLVETTEEDRALISLSTALYPLLMKYADTEEKLVKVGKIGDLVNTPLSALDNVSIELQQNDDFMRRSVDDDDDALADLSDAVRVAFWDPNEDVFVINLKHIKKPVIRRTITHELRHALDDMKSEYMASASDKYMTAKKKVHQRDQVNSYLAKPGEINARFTQTMHLIVLKLEKLFNITQDVPAIRKEMMYYLELVFQTNHISTLFPEREKSKDYKRLMKRAVDFIDKEIKYRSSQLSQ